MERNKLRIWLAMALAALLCSQADARLIESWSLQRIKDTAGLVLVGTVASTGHWHEKLEDPLFGEHLEGRLTTFDVGTVFKGDVPTKQIELVHYQVKDGGLIDNGPLLASFRKTGRRLEIESVDGVKEKAHVLEGTPHYLLFLKKRGDGKYEPVSGQIDSALSVRKLSGIDPLLESRPVATAGPPTRTSTPMPVAPAASSTGQSTIPAKCRGRGTVFR
jgi:hypothetical protein